MSHLEEGLPQGLACSFVGNHEEVQHQHKPYPSHQNLYDKATSAALFNSSIGDWFRTRVGVRQGCLLSPTLFNIFLERLEAEHSTTFALLMTLSAKKVGIY